MWSRPHHPQHWLQLCSLDRDVGREFPADNGNCHCPHSFWLICVTSNQLHHPSEPQMPTPSSSTQGRAIGKPGLCAMRTQSCRCHGYIPAAPPLTTIPGVPLLPLQKAQFQPQFLRVAFPDHPTTFPLHASLIAGTIWETMSSGIRLSELMAQQLLVTVGKLFYILCSSDFSSILQGL